MEFIDSYKRLDQLCKDINGKGVTGYIEDMDNNPSGQYRVTGWTEDYKSLKHYRWVRNSIVHDVGVSEKSLCNPGDTEWLENFRQRIIRGEDPLTRLREINGRLNRQPQKATESAVRSGCLTLAVIAVLAVLILGLCVLKVIFPNFGS